MASSSTTHVRTSSTKLRRDSSRDEYDLWRETMLGLLESANLVGHVNGDLPLPPETDIRAHKDWKRMDLSVKDWIMDALSDDILPTVIAFRTSRDVWSRLEIIFTHPTTTPSVLPPNPVAHLGIEFPSALYKAALRGDWDATRAILNQHPDAAEARAVPNSYTALHIAVGTGKAIPYLQSLINYMSDEALEIKSTRGYTALCMAARMGNLAAAKMLVDRRPDLLYVPENWGIYPVAQAASSGHRPTIEFFIAQTQDDLELPYAGENGVLLLSTLIDLEFFDIALDLIERYPNLAARKQELSGRSALKSIASKNAAFLSGARFNFWERLIYSGMQTEMGTELRAEFGMSHGVVRSLHAALYQVIMLLVPRAKWIHEQKVKHHQARKLVTCLCEHLELVSDQEATFIYADAMLKAAELGVHEVIEIIVEKFPVAVYCADPLTRGYFFHIAVANRSEKVFNLIYQMSDHKHSFPGLADSSGGCLLHLVAILAPPQKLNLVSGAALQMQRELQWFKEIEKWLDPYERELPNYEGKTAQMIFTEEHSNLKAEGERWMKDTANSCSIAAALIATVVFAAAITVPGGNADSGYPLFVKSGAFIIFAVSDAISLFTSSTSLLLFLSILTSRYAEEDFLHALPKRLCLGLFTLFLSILFMMAAFSATIYLVFGEKSSWVLIPVAVLACLPVTSFVLLQFPLLVDVTSSTYGRGIFGKQSDDPFH